MSADLDKRRRARSCTSDPGCSSEPKPKSGCSEAARPSALHNHLHSHQSTLSAKLQHLQSLQHSESLKQLEQSKFRNPLSSELDQQRTVRRLTDLFNALCP